MAAPTISPPARVAGGPRANKLDDSPSIADGKLSRYREALANTPPAGAGLRHNHCWTVACRAVAAGISEVEAIDDWSDATGGTRRQARAEMHDAYQNAVKNAPQRPVRAYWRKSTKGQAPKRQSDTDAFWRAALAAHPPEDAQAELWESSPIALKGDPSDDLPLVLTQLYKPDDILYIGMKADDAAPGENLRPVKDWLRGGTLAPCMIPNPLTGHPERDNSGNIVLSDNGKPRYKSVPCVADFRFCVVEFDEKPRDEEHRQYLLGKWAAFFLYADLPLAAVIMSGAKSLHGWLRADCTNLAEWDRKIRPYYRGLLKDLGADNNLQSPNHPSRTPGQLREDPPHRRQSLLYLNPGILQ